MIKNGVCAAVIIYNPSQDYIENLKSYSDQVQMLIVFDNSESQSIQRKLQIIKISNAHYEWFGKNMGVGYALNCAVRYTKKYNLHYLLTMDQDSRFCQGSIAELLIPLKSEGKAVLSFPALTTNNPHISSPSIYKYKKISITSGMLLDTQKLKNELYFKEDFFIDGIDTEFCLRLFKSKKKIIQATHVCMKHELGSEKILRIFGLKISVTHHSSTRVYYHIRNGIRICKHHPSFTLSFLIRTSKEILKLIYFSKNIRNEIFIVKKALIDGFQNIGGVFHDN